MRWWPWQRKPSEPSDDEAQQAVAKAAAQRAYSQWQGRRVADAERAAQELARRSVKLKIGRASCRERV